MKVTTVRRGAQYTVSVVQGNQGFFLDYIGPEDECRWYARMFRRALKYHDKEVQRKRNEA
jgi:hypothetical protein